MRTAVVIAGLCLQLVLGNSPALAHHAFTQYDRAKVITLTGLVRTFEYTNPHSYLWLVVRNEKDGEDIWGLEFSSGVAGLERSGWTRQTLKYGDKVTVELNPLKNGTTGGSIVRVHLPDGRTLLPAPPLPGDVPK